MDRARAQTILGPLVGGLLILVALIGLIGTAIKNPQPHDIKVGLVGPTPALEQISTAFAANAPGAFQFTTYGSEDAARSAIDDRSVDGALVFGPDGGPRLIVAGAAGDAVTGVISGAFTNVFKAQGQTLTVETVHPFARVDPHGLILFFVVLAVVVSTLVAQAAFGLRSQSGFGLRLIMVVVYAVLAALVGMGMARWIRVLGRDRPGRAGISRRWGSRGGQRPIARGTRRRAGGDHRGAARPGLIWRSAGQQLAARLLSLAGAGHAGSSALQRDAERALLRQWRHRLPDRRAGRVARGWHRTDGAR